MSAQKWPTDAERRAVTDLCPHAPLHKACEPCSDTVETVLGVLAVHVARREREAAALALREAADSWQQGGWADTPRRADRVADRIAAAQFVGDWIRERAEQADS